MVVSNIVEVTCRYCGKKFVPAPQHALKDTYGQYCKPTCFLHRDELKKPRSKRVFAFSGDEVEIFSSATVAASKLGGEAKLIRDACRKGTTYKGYTWKYEE